MFPFILFIFFLSSSLEHNIAAFSPTITSLYDSFRNTKHTYNTFSARLIHRSSPDSPFFNPNYTRNDHIKNSLRNSQARSHYFSQRKASSDKNYVAAPVFAWEFIMEYTMGTPPVNRYGVLDTGSSFTWFQCLPCFDCYRQMNIPFFNPKQSTSYQQVLCDTFQCEISPRPTCSNTDKSLPCRYDIRYGGGIRSRGVVSMDTFAISADNTSKTLNNMVFGCADDTQGQDVEGLPGVVGVGNSTSSLLFQLGVSHLSYFYFANGTNINGEVHFGPGASLSGSGTNTPFFPSDDGLFYLNLVGISVDGSDLDLPPGFFDKYVYDDGIQSGFVIDSGTTFTMLQHEAFDKLKDAIADEMYMYTQVKHARFELCFKDYKGGAPEVVFQFKGLDYALCDANLWIKQVTQTKVQLHCLAFSRNKKRGSKMSILGFHQQRNVQVGYDLENNLLTLNYPDSCPEDVIDFMQ
ncbi:aspartic proteinase CDR1 [Beta vulgaris subsp. vulgaris]|uniref:aspartic proteinase CDR1 n=1 Tax=Beta vulgaris subsp. vulgaris TaxID=3555 RepID=UPI002036EC31|nr:aspartic proteinase CDR1 [Beta vulgaris subsp. vulgaris]